MPGISSTVYNTLLAQGFDVLSSLEGALLCCCLLTQVIQHLGLHCLYNHVLLHTLPNLGMFC